MNLFIVVGRSEPLQLNRLERVAGIEPAYFAWEANVPKRCDDDSSLGLHYSISD